MMKQYNLYNLIAGWVTFVISAVVYLLTIEPSASFGIAVNLSPQPRISRWDILRERPFS